MCDQDYQFQLRVWRQEDAPKRRGCGSPVELAYASGTFRDWIAVQRECFSLM